MYHYLNNPRFQCFFDTPNQCAAVIAMFAIISAGIFLFFSVRSENKSDLLSNKIYISLAALSFGVCLFLEYFLVKTYSRGGYVAFIVGLLTLFFMTRRKRALLIIFSMFLLFIIIPDGTQRTVGIANIADASIGNRIELWKGALAMSADYWYSGVGFGYGGPFFKIYPAWYQPLWMKTFYNTAVCDYLTLSAKGGIFLLFGYLFLSFSILFSSCLLYFKNKNLILAGVICAQLAYLISGIFSTFFNVDYVVIPFFILQGITLLWILIDLSITIFKANKKVTRPTSEFNITMLALFKNVFQSIFRLVEPKSLISNFYLLFLRICIPFFMSFFICLVILLAGVYFRSQIGTKYEFKNYKGLKVAIVSPQYIEPEGIILYLFNSDINSLEDEARGTLRPLSEKGFIVISAETEGGFKGLDESRILRELVFALAKKQTLPVMFAGEEEGGRFSIILAAIKNDNIELSPVAVVSVDSELEWPFPKLSPKNYLDQLTTPHHSITKSIDSAGAAVLLGRGDILSCMSKFFRANIKKSNDLKIKKSQIKYIDYANASKEDINSAKGWIFGGRICPRCDYLKAELIPKLISEVDLSSRRLLVVEYISSATSGHQNRSLTTEELEPKSYDFKIIYVDLEKAENVLLLMKLEERLGVTGQKTPVLLWNDTLYYGNDSVARIVNDGDSNVIGNSEVMDILRGEDDLNEEEILKKRASGFKFSIIAIAGLIDGINPGLFNASTFTFRYT